MQRQVVFTPQTSLFLSRDRGDRHYRYTHYYVPASTIAGAVNTYLYRRGHHDLMRKFRFSNLYPQDEEDRSLVWVPSPRNLLFCPACGRSHVVETLDPAEAYESLICSCQKQALRKPHRGFVLARVDSDRWLVHGATDWQEARRSRRMRVVDSQLIGRTPQNRVTGIKVEHLLHAVEIIKRKDVLVEGGESKIISLFRGDVLTAGDKLTDKLKGLHLRVGGLLTRGCGYGQLDVEDDGSSGASPWDGGAVLVVETPLLPLPKSLEGLSSEVVTVNTTSMFALVETCERWSVKLGRLIAFPQVLGVGSVLWLAGPVAGPSASMFFYRPGDQFELHRFAHELCLGEEHPAISVKEQTLYTLAELWSLGFGRLRRLDSLPLE